MLIYLKKCLWGDHEPKNRVRIGLSKIVQKHLPIFA